MLNNKSEMRLYEILGVRLFQKLVFRLEKFVHRKDNGININYHLSARDFSALDAFIKYLFYNGTIHTRNLILYALYLLAKTIFQWKYGAHDLLLSLLAVKDLYCVMLQRYNYLRIERLKEILSKQRANRNKVATARIKEAFSSSYDFSFAETDLQLIKKIKTCIANRESIILTDYDIATLDRLIAATQNSTDSSY